MSSSSRRKPHVVVVDDEPLAADRRLIRTLVDLGVNAELVAPADITADHLRAADVFALDEYLNVWPGRDAAPLAMQPRDGISVAAVLRAHLELDTVEREGATAFVIRTNDLARLADPVPARASQHLIAAHHGLEWVQKKDAGGDEADRLRQLATAVRALPDQITDDDGTLSRKALRWLGLRDQPWRPLAEVHIDDCRPAAHRLAEATGGASFLRWFLHGVLPYPTFLVGDVRAATALGLTANSFRRIATSDSALSTALAGARYEGQTATFFGRRWWRAGINSLLAELTDGRPADRAGLATGLRDLHGSRVGTLGVDRRGVVVLDKDFQPKSDPSPIEEAVRIRPDDWPSYADEAWAALSDVTDHPELRAVVVGDDRARVEAYLLP